MENFAFVKNQIKTFITMQDVFDKYASYLPKSHGRYKCPFNHKEDRYNLVIKDNGWHCFSCGGGDQINFVQKLFDIPFAKAVEKIAIDFKLAFDPNSAENQKLERELKRRQKQRENDQKKAKTLDLMCSNAYNYVINKIRKCEKRLDYLKPNNRMPFEKYINTSLCDEYIKTQNLLRKYNFYADILMEVDTDECMEYETFGTIALTKEEMHNRLIKFIKKIYIGEVNIDGETKKDARKAATN